ncbi:Crp/Fnr family transcriptional regulator [Listeria rocourtiae]|uniref:Crp/Fnr family transcriptional regulator n=1 Tax=Listeria rocourtiae TaxID=647910 RepID=UPI003D2F9A94
MLFLKEGKSSITVTKLIEYCFEDPDFNKYCSVSRTKKGDILQNKQGEEFKIYFILSGIYGVVIQSDKPKGGITRFLGKHDCFGLHHIYYDSWEPSQLLQSLGHGEIMEVDSSFLCAILNRYDQEGTFFMAEYMAEELREYQYFCKLTFLKKEERIRKVLLKTGLELGTETEDGIILPRQLTQEVLGRYTNTSREYVAHTVMNLIEAGILRNRPKPLLIIDRDRL